MFTFDNFKSLELNSKLNSNAKTDVSLFNTSRNLNSNHWNNKMSISSKQRPSTSNFKRNLFNSNKHDTMDLQTFDTTRSKKDTTEKKTIPLYSLLSKTDRNNSDICSFIPTKIIKPSLISSLETKLKHDLTKNEKKHSFFKTNIIIDNQKLKEIYKKGIKKNLPEIISTLNKPKLIRLKKIEREEFKINLEKEESFHNKIDILVSNYHKISQYAGFKNIHCRKSSNPKYRTKFAKSNVNKTEEMTPVERLLENFVPVKDFSKQLKITNVQNFVRDIDLSLTKNNFYLLKPEKLNEKYRMYQDTLHPDKDTQLNRIKRQEKDKKLIIQTEIIEITENDSQDISIIEIRKTKILRWKKVIYLASIYFPKLNLTLNEFYSKYPPKKAFQNEGSILFFKAIKEGDTHIILKMLANDKFLIYDFDDFHQTPLHYAVKRNHAELVPILIKMGNHIDSEDCQGKTAFHVACLNNNENCVMKLLLEMANPFNKFRDKRPLDITTNNNIKCYINRAKLLHTIHRMNNMKLFETRVKNGLEFCFNRFEKDIDF